MSGQMVPALDLRDAGDPRDMPQVMPNNVEAEQALLGAVFFDNGVFERCDEIVQDKHFYEPFHQRLWAAISKHARQGQLADPILMAERFNKDPAFDDLGGVSYLAMLVDRAPPGANAPDYAREIRDLATRRDLIRIAGEVSKVARDNEDEISARDMVEAAEQDLYALAETGQVSQGFVAFEDSLTKAITTIGSAMSRDGSLAGLATGLIDLDQKLGGLHPTDLLILAARPSMGKTALAVNIAYNVAKHYQYEPQPDGTKKTVHGGVVAFFSIEMSDEQLALRILAEVSGISGDRLRKGDIDPMEYGRIRDAALEIQSIPLFTDATGGINIGKIRARARRLKRTVGLDLVVVDYLQLADAGLKGQENRVQQVSVITQSLKALAKELHVPVVALSQLSRQVEQRDNKRPQLSDLRESGSIEQDADAVLFIYRESYYLERAEPKSGTEEHFKWQEALDQSKGVAEVIIGKQRHGPIGTVRLSFNEDLTKFGNLARDSHYSDFRQAPLIRDPTGESNRDE